MKNILITLVAAGIVVMAGCAGQHIPKQDYPLEIEKEYNVSFDRAWEAVNEVIRSNQGQIIFCDKESGVICYDISEKENNLRYYVNVYVKTIEGKLTTVYLIPYTWGGRSLKGIDNGFYDKLNKLI
jgi:hypothetical protein